MARRGPAGVLRIEGVAGIGKTTLWSCAVDLARARGDRLMVWRASTAERDIAFAVLTALFDLPPVIAVLAGLPDPRRRALEVALGRADPAPRSPEPGLVGLAVADVLRLLAARRPGVGRHRRHPVDRSGQRGRVGLRRPPAGRGAGRPRAGPADSADDGAASGLLRTVATPDRRWHPPCRVRSASTSVGSRSARSAGCCTSGWAPPFLGRCWCGSTGPATATPSWPSR